MRRHGDEGVAALEMAIISVVLMMLAFGGLPLFALMHGYQVVNGSSAGTLRYATAVYANPTPVASDGSGNPVLSRRPTRNDITRFAQAAQNDSSLSVTTVVYVGTTGSVRARRAGSTDDDPIEAISGDTVVITVSKSVDLTLLGNVANAASALAGQGDVFPHDVRTLTSTASGREE